MTTSFLLSAVSVALFSLSAHATIVVNSIDDSRVSAYDGLTTGTTAITIYGGLAGADCTGLNGGADNTVTTCSSCVAPADSVALDARLQPCNDRRINQSLILSLSVTSATVDGYATIATGAASTGTGTTAGVILGNNVGQTLVNHTNPATINIPWSTICANMTTTSSTGTTAGAVPTGCVLPSGADGATGTFNVGIRTVQTETSTTSADDVASITIVLRAGETPDASLGSIASTGGSGITYYEVESGDNKGTLGTLQSTPSSGFPVYLNSRFRWVRVLFEKRDPALQNDPTGTVWSKISSGSPHVDLEIQSSATDVTNLNLSPITIESGTARDASGNATSVGVSNGGVYDTKVAVVDAARNVAFYTPHANDIDCNNTATSKSPLTGVEECHTIRPALVVGVLANKVNCFIATASYGSPMAKEVDTFRHFRDQYLIPTKLGLKFVRWYYNEGPKYAAFIRQNDTYRAIARGFLWLPLQFAKVSLDDGLFAGIVFLLSALLSPFALIYFALRKLRSRGAISNA